MVIVLGTLEHHRAAFERVGILGIGEIALAELVRDHAQLHDRGIEQIAGEHLEAGILPQRLGIGADHVRISDRGAFDILAHGLAVDRACVPMNAPREQELVHHRRQAAGAIVFLAEIVARGLHVHQQRHVVADGLPILDVERHADMARDRVDVDGRVGRAADGGAGDDRVLERFAGEDVGWLQVLVHDLDGAATGLISDLCALAIGRGDGGAAGQRKAQGFRQRVHGRGGSHRVAVANRGRRRRDEVEELRVVLGLSLIHI